MKLYQSLKTSSIRILESHPFGYVLGGIFLERCDFLLPHEADYYGFPVLAKSAYPADGLILDLGANRGHSARAFLRLLPEARVHSVEANPLHQAHLEKIRSKGVGRFTYSINAISNASGTRLTLYTPCYGTIRLHSATSIFAKEAVLAFEQAYPALKEKVTIEVNESESITGDELGLDVTFVKLDVQGSELAALQGMKRTIERCRPALLVEKSSSYGGVAPFLEDLGYRPWRFSADSGKFKEGVGSFDTHHSNVFFIPSEKSSLIPG